MFRFLLLFCLITLPVKTYAKSSWAKITTSHYYGNTSRYKPRCLLQVSVPHGYGRNRQIFVYPMLPNIKVYSVTYDPMQRTDLLFIAGHDWQSHNLYCSGYNSGYRANSFFRIYYTEKKVSNVPTFKSSWVNPAKTQNKKDLSIYSLVPKLYGKKQQKAYSYGYSYGCAENGSCYGDMSRHTNRPKTIRVKGYYRKNGTYVRGHYRSRNSGLGNAFSGGLGKL